MTAPRVLAGLDVGNATTEVVLVDPRVHPPRPLAADRAPTRGAKGTARANEGAARLAARLAQRHGLVPTAAAVTGQRAVTTATRVVTEAPPPVAPLALLGLATRTPGRPGAGSGVPVRVDAPPRPGPDVVLVVPPDVPFAAAARHAAGWLARRDAARVAAVVVARDEGVLVAARLPALPAGVPVVDGVDAAHALRLPRVAVEAAPAGQPVVGLADPLRLVTLFGLDGAARQAARVLAAALADAPNAVVGLDPDAPAGPAPTGPATAGISRDGPDPADLRHWAVDLAVVGAGVEARTTAGRCRTVVSATLADAAATDVTPQDVVAGVLGVPVHRVATEAVAARTGALTTPGARDGCLVLDLGGGTLDAIGPAGPPLVAAGAGDLLTAATAAALAVSRGAAEWVKRGPCHRVESPHLLLGEDGTRHFADRPVPAAAVGSLAVPGPAGWLPFARDLAPAEWRALRLRLKRAVLGDNLARLLAALPGGTAGRDVVLAGGVAGDPEILRVLDRALAGATVGRADVAGSTSARLGHRWAVAYGLTLLACEDGAAG